MKNTKMKKFLAVVLSAALVAGLAAGCGSKEDGKEEDKGSSAKTAKVIDVDLTNEEYAFGIDKDQPELVEQVNAFIKEVKEDGTLDEICDKYFGGGEPAAVESAKLDESKDQLVVATNAAFEPFEYTKGDKYVGIDMELAALLAEKLGKEKESCIETYISIEKQMKEVKNEDENDVLFYRYVKGLRFWEIAEIMGYSEQWIHKLHGRALGHLKLPT